MKAARPNNTPKYVTASIMLLGDKYSYKEGTAPIRNGPSVLKYDGR